MDPISSFNDLISVLETEGYGLDIKSPESLDLIKGSNYGDRLLEKLASTRLGLKIYYPVARAELFPPVPVTYSTVEPISAQQIAESILNFYQTSLSPENIAAYKAANSAYYRDIRSGFRVADVMDPRHHFVKELVPFEDGYTLKLQ